MLSEREVKYFSSLKLKKNREKEGKFLIEGFHLIEECLNSSFTLELIIIRSGTREEGLLSKAKKRNIRVANVSERIFRRLSETEHSQGVAGVAVKRSSAPVIPAGSAAAVVALDRISDPGNLGTILRNAYWFRADLVLVSSGSADVYNSKVLRASQGAIFRLNISEDADLADSIEGLHRKGFEVYLLSPHADTNISRLRLSGRSVFVFGNEAGGISEVISKGGYKRIKIGSYSECESLNVAVSSGIVLNTFREMHPGE